MEGSGGLALCDKVVPEESPGKLLVKVQPSCRKEPRHYGDPLSWDGHQEQHW